MLMSITNMFLAVGLIIEQNKKAFQYNHVAIVSMTERFVIADYEQNAPVTSVTL